MKPTFLIVIVILFLSFACSNNSENSQPEIDGEYIGIFERNGVTTSVELNFDNGVYTGVSEAEKFPAICNGIYSVSDTSILFQNECGWTADFDWTLILSEQWNFEIDGNILTLVKANGDRYILTKQ